MLNFGGNGLMEDATINRVDLRLNNKEFYKKYGRKKIISTYTLGCKVNQYETEAMEQKFESEGYETVPFNQKADIYVINTCSVTTMADKKSRQMLSKAKKKNKDAVIVAVGCYAQVAHEKLKKDAVADIIIGNTRKNSIVKLVEDYICKKEKTNLVDNIHQVKRYEDLWISKVNHKTRAYIKIQDGCNQFCSFCIIPYTRGRIRSRGMEDTIHEVQALTENGYKEIVLTGIHLASYGKDLEGASLSKLLERLSSIQGLKRIRLGSLEPNIVTTEFVSHLITLKKVCPHFHLSLQSGCNATLERMNRKYTTEQYLDRVQMIRNYYKEPSITTDIIVGFPGETEEEYQQTVSFVEKVNFSSIHVFKYSKREGTVAARRKDQVDGNIKHERSQHLIALGEKLKQNYINGFIGYKKKVLFEESIQLDNKAYHTGYTNNYIKVIVRNDQNLENSIQRVDLKIVKNDMVLGNLLQ